MEQEVTCSVVGTKVAESEIDQLCTQQTVLEVDGVYGELVPLAGGTLEYDVVVGIDTVVVHCATVVGYIERSVAVVVVDDAVDAVAAVRDIQCDLDPGSVGRESSEQRHVRHWSLDFLD